MSIIRAPHRPVIDWEATREELMRRNVLTAGVMACGLVVFGSVPVFATQMHPVRASTRPADRFDTDTDRPTEGGSRLWDRIQDRLTIPLGLTGLDPWPYDPCRAPCREGGN
jgi:hypothetical protein